jgi:hypothetical protein
VCSELSFVEILRRKGAYLRMHSVLNIEHIDWISFVESETLIEPFEKWLIELAVLSQFREDGCRQLLRIAYLNYATAAESKRNQTFNFETLSCLE